jgi:HEAT repeat protein
VLFKAKCGVLPAVLACVCVVNAAEAPAQKAWVILRDAVTGENTERRVAAVRALGLLPDDIRARALAEKALVDAKPEVRVAAATALGDMRSKSSVPKLRAALDDKDTSVVLAAAHALQQMQDPEAYRIYFEVLTGELKGGGNLLGDQIKTLRDPKKLAEMGFERALGEIPFVGMGFSAVKAITKDDASPVRAAAARELAADPDPRTGKALVHAAFDNSWVVRRAALEAIARRGDRAAVRTIRYSLEDDKDEVRFTAAAAVIRLSGKPGKK